MAEQISLFEDTKLNQQFLEILKNLDPENFRYNNPTIRRDDGTLVILKCDNTNNLYVEEV